VEAARRRVSEVMQTEVATLGASERLDLAEDVMRLGRVRHMPVLDGTKLVGIVSNRDLLAASLTRALDFEPAQRRAFMRSIEVAEVMSHDLITVERDATLREAAQLLVRHQIGCLPVVRRDGTLVGLVTETDLLRAALIDAAGDVDAAKPSEGTIMAEWKERYEREVGELRRVRDELKVRVHLAKADAKDRWEKLEQQFHRLEAKGRQISQLSAEPLQDVRDAAKLLIDEIREGYRRIREAL
jgi:CBS domain-containing protein